MNDDEITEEDIKKAVLYLQFLEYLPEIAKTIRRLCDSLERLTEEHKQTIENE